MSKRKDVIPKDNVLRIRDDELLAKLNEIYSKMQGVVYSSRNNFLVEVLRLGIEVWEKQQKDNWAIKNETTTLLDAIHEHTKRMNFFIKFSQPFIKTAYADCEVNQQMLSILYNYMLVKMDSTEKRLFLKDLEKYSELPQEFASEKKRKKDYYTYKTE